MEYLTDVYGKGNRRSPLIIFLFILLALGGTPLAALEVDVVIPQVRSNNPLVTAALQDLVSGVLDEQLEETLERDLGERLDGYDSLVLTRGFTNTGIYSVHSATQFGRYDYDSFSVSIGSMASFQVPSIDPTTLSNIIENFDSNPDVLFGASWQVWSAQVGLNLGVFDESLDRLSVGLKFGYSPLRLPFTDRVTFDFTAWNVGALVNFALVEPTSSFILGWQGLNLASGFIAEGNNIKLIIQQDELYSQYRFGSDAGILQNETVRFEVNPLVSNEIDVLTFTIPIELSTGISLVGGLLNLSIGGGGDINFGSSRLIVTATTDLSTTLSGVLGEDVEFSDGSVRITKGSKEALAPFFVPKIMTGLSVGVGPVYLSMPVSFYFNLPEDLGSDARIEDVGIGVSGGVTLGFRL